MGEQRSGHEPPGADVYGWVDRLADELGVPREVIDVEAVLDLARETAQGVARPAVPLTGFFVGYAVGAGGKDRAELDRVAAAVTALARAWAGASGPEAGR